MQVSQWLGILQAVVIVPVMLRLLRRRYKMPWSCLLHSQLYLAMQALDLAAIVSLAAGSDNRSLRLTAEVSVYLAAVYLCVCCMTLATPPVYIGPRIVRRYMLAVPHRQVYFKKEASVLHECCFPF